MSVLLLLACASPPEAQLFTTAMDPDTPLEQALAACAAMEQGDECTATVVARREDAGPEPCQELRDPWRQECHFRVAERLGKRGERGEALIECGLSGPYYDECLYHLWSFELQAASEPPSSEVQSRAVDHLERARPVVRYYRGLRNLAQDPEELIWDDYWYFAHNRNRPARGADCAALSGADLSRCERGTHQFVRRLVAETLIRPSTDSAARDRACRSGELPAWLGEGAWERAEPSLNAAALEGLADACASPPRRPWNPTFVPVQPLGGT